MMFRVVVLDIMAGFINLVSRGLWGVRVKKIKVLEKSL
jgi:hypothetical protein